ncbi:GNL3L/Grn1 putative GTPase family protein [Theileria parva strain Muguga]|uniref:Guanine nucleotide-binding protein-like 3 N-terminal domain-containing protein n=1 Tax=Theileria parva TaxID=5875 RepID=Q4N3F0_THEPA|nr:GNL3L/Grn1 putative GTPase family protein [Theileria parva strain Muguga]EAN31389.1 GNL3L/Grn1 putative GTPase family protein [Theileria parva strain Muguga]|eukprot:XP_763672.1 hypothetical protein [Theileria parva strain Muguga]
MVKLKKGTKRQELARKYNIQRMVSAHKKKLRRMAKKGLKAPTKAKIPEIPNCIFKKDILSNLKRTKEINDRKKELQKVNKQKLQE